MAYSNDIIRGVCAPPCTFRKFSGPLQTNMSSFSADQVRTFRQIFSQFTDEERGGLTRENFVPAASASLEHCTLRSRPTDVYLAGEFSRLAGDAGAVNWQQFFQVCVSFNRRKHTIEYCCF